MTTIPTNLDEILSQKQQRVLSYALTHDFFMLINHGAKRSGKTAVDNLIFLCELARVKRMADEAGVKEPQYILAGADLSAIQRNVLNPLSSDYGLDFKFDKFNRFLIFGVKVCCFGHSKINDLGRIRGMTAWGAYINEITVANEKVFDEIKSRCSAPGARIIGDTNPDRPSHWLKKDYIDKADGKTIVCFHWLLTDNSFLTDRYIKSIIESTPAGVFTDRNIKGLWVAAEGAVYPDFRRDIHYITPDKLPEISKFWAGMDFGWEHPGAVVLFGESKDGTIYLLKEYASKHRSIQEWSKILINLEQKINEHIEKMRKQEEAEMMANDPLYKYHFHKKSKYKPIKLPVYCDSARPDLIAELQKAGINAINAHKDVVAGIGEVATLLHNNKLFIIYEQNMQFDKEIDAYVWKKDADEPVKTNDDVMDAVRYGIYSEKVERANMPVLNDADYIRGGY